MKTLATRISKTGFSGGTGVQNRQGWRRMSRLLKLGKEVEVKVKVTLVHALRLCTARTAHRGSRGIALPFHDHGTRRR